MFAATSITQGLSMLLNIYTFNCRSNNKFENDLVFLVHSSRAYGIVVKTEDIDWKDELQPHAKLEINLKGKARY
jgi:hypothetical protein